MRVKLTKEQKIQVLNSRDIALIMQQILLRENKIGRSKEHFWVVCLSNSNRILLIELISLGNGKKTIVDPTEIFSFALQKRAVKLIMVHNHPSGELQPSLEDQDITDRMYQVGLFLDLPVIDHLIISETELLQLCGHRAPAEAEQKQEVCAQVQGRRGAVEEFGA